MDEDLMIVETYMDHANGMTEWQAFSKLKEILMAWDNNDYIEEHTQLKKEIKGA